MLRLASLLSVGLLMTGCSLPEQIRTEAGPAFTLTADAPVAAFEVTLCLTGPDPKSLYVRGRVNAVATTDADRDLQLHMESLDRPVVADDEHDAHARTLELPASGDVEGGFGLLAEAQWKGSGRRCAEPEAIQFAVDGLQPGESVTVEDWDVTMTAQWNDGSFGSGPDDEDLSVEIVRL
mgnify:CR=1 FL=1